MTTTGDSTRSQPGPRRTRPPGFPFLTRELSWLDFNERVLYQAEDARNPLLERVRFLAIFASNLDEFFQVRVSGLLQQVAAGHSTPTPDGLSASQKLDRIRGRVLQLQAQHADLWDAISGELAAEGIRVLPPEDRPQRQNELRQRFMDEIFPVLTPLAVDPSHPFPYISDLSLSLAVTVRDPANGDRRFARIKVPPVLPRMWEVAPRTYVLLERVIAANLDALFPGMEVESHHLFRVTRNADLDIEEDEADDLLMAMEEELRRRRFGKVVRLEVERSMPHETRALLQRGLSLDPSNIYEIRGMLDLRGLESIADLDIPGLQPAPWKPVTPPRLSVRDEDADGGVDIFARIREGDILLHHPYESFTNSVQRLIQQAAEDPDVLTIKMTLYRTSGDSPIVHSLIRAAESGKQVVVMVEIKARFDERANIVWARALERAGAHVAYGLLGLKTHSKCTLIIRREAGGLRRYAHIGTGNYNHRTARIYTDLGLLTADRVLTGDVTDLFNVLTGVARKDRYRELLVAPKSMRPMLEDLIEGEMERHREHGDGRIIIKCNACVDPQMIRRLYQASQAGVPIDLIVRGMCSLQPGVPGFSESIHVRSIVGRYLEHSRIFCFGQGDRERYFIGSADLMERNLDRRVEAITPVKDAALQDELRKSLAIMRRDDRRAWTLGEDGEWTRVETTIDGEPSTDTFEALMDDALQRAEG
ncbi:MAG TPA: polyphosphate kinase 1 [Anaerolineae bacterium]|nr:polyphosphate kinase 1 [Anaerolineae bacterium]